MKNCIYTKNLYQDCKVRSEGYVNREGNEEGYWECFYTNGQMYSQGNWKNGVKVGCWRYFYSNGQTKELGDYKEGKQVGNWRYYDENGRLEE